MTGALAGIRVVDFTRVLSGPLASMLLGDLGADVIKVEPPAGDSYRDTAGMAVHGLGVNFISVNRNKRSVTLDLRSPDAAAVVRRLVRDADVVVENFRPAVSAALGLDYERLSEVNPQLVVCSITGFGRSGPLRDLPAVDPIIQAMSGIMDLTGDPDGPPTRTGTPVGDIYAGMLAVQGVLAALVARGRTGVGQQVDVSLLDACMLGLIPREGSFFATGKAESRGGDRHPSLAPFQRFPAQDGEVFIAVFTESMWVKLCAVLELPDLRDDPRFATMRARREHCDELAGHLEKALRTDTAASWQRRLGAAGVPAAPINTLREVLTHPAAIASGMVTSVPDGDAGDIAMLGNPIRMSGNPTEIRLAPPRLGEHNDDVYAELGFTDDELAALRESGVI